jgi:ribosomal protein S15P/S13E
MDKKSTKKLEKMKERLTELEATLLSSITKKDSKSAEVNVPMLTNQINKLKQEIKEFEK